MQAELLRERFVLSLYIVIFSAVALIVDALLGAAQLSRHWLVVLPVAVASSGPWLYFQVRSARAASRAALEFIGVLALFAVAMQWTSDYSFDGTHYHLPATLALKDGWNPFHEETGGTWADHYPWGAWALRALVVQITGRMDTGRIINIAYVFASYQILVYYLAARGPSPVGPLQKVLAFVCAASPTAVGQLLTNCVDVQLAALFLILIVCLMLSADPGKSKTVLAGAAAATVLLVNTKMSGLYFAFFAIAAGLAGLWARNGFRRRWLLSHASMTGILLAAGVVGVFLVGYRPYATNLIEHGALVYPPVREILKGFFPEHVAQTGWPTKFLYGVFSETGAFALKRPWQVHWREWSKSDGLGPGFGPLFGLEVLGAVVLLGVGLYRSLAGKRAVNQELLYASGAIVLCCLAFPENGLARYIPVAPLALTLAVLSVEAGLPRFALWAFAGLALLNVAPTAGKSLWSGYVINRDIGNSIRILRQTPGGERVVIAADGGGAWHVHFMQRLLAENGVSASFGECPPDATFPGFQPYSSPRICVAK